MKENGQTELGEETTMENCFEYTACPVCGSDNRRTLCRVINNWPEVIDRLDRLGKKLRECAGTAMVVRCVNCGHSYLYPRLSGAILNEYYASDQYKYYDYMSVLPAGYFQKRYMNILSLIQKTLHGGRLLEIGCGTGDFLSILSERWDAYGVEPSHLAVSQLRKRGIRANVHNGFIEEDLYTPGYFDVVVLFDVIEHLPNPRKVFSSIRCILRSGGMVVIQTGNIGSISAKILKGKWSYFASAEHISFFSPASLSYLFNLSGFVNPRLYGISYDPSIKRNLMAQYSNVRLLIKKCILFALGRKRNVNSFAGLHDHFVAVSFKSHA